MHTDLHGWDFCFFLRVLCGSFEEEGGEFEEGVPVAGGAAEGEVFFDEGVGKFGGADAVGVGDVEFAVVGGEAFGAFDGLLEGVDVFGWDFGFEEHDEEVAGVGMGFGREGVAGEDGAEFGGGAEEVVGGDFVVGFGLLLEEEFEGGEVLGRGGVEEEVAALEEGGGVGEMEFGEKFFEVGHRKHVFAADVDAAEEGEVGGHKGSWFGEE
jgi:hypothetical protein